MRVGMIGGATMGAGIAMQNGLIGNYQKKGLHRRAQMGFYRRRRERWQL
ncbi:hypothetical protein [Lacrimispora sp. JR3]